MNVKRENYNFLNEIKIGSLICVVALLYTLPYLSAFEFFRHTEADRALIAWEMVQRPDFITPHILGEVIVTKPPLYYWLLATVFSISGELSEYNSRIVSAIATALLALLQYNALFLSGWSRRAALLSSCVLIFSGEIFIYSLIAEIDLTYTFFSALTLYLGFFSLKNRTPLLLTLLAYLALALAFLVKGPPILVFFGISSLAWTARYWKEMPLYSLTRWVFVNIFGVLLAIITVAIWVITLKQASPHIDLWAEFNTEILQRFTSDPSAGDRSRGPFFYLGSVLIGMLPFSLVLFPYLKHRYIRTNTDTAHIESPAYSSVFYYSCSIVLPALILFSLASGKSSRYLLPIYPFLANILTVFALRLNKNWVERTLIFMAVFIFLARIPYCTIFASSRNSNLTVKPYAAEISALTPVNAPIYVLSLQQRWIPYYLIRAGRTVLKLTTEELGSLSSIENSQKIYLLTDNLDKPEEINKIAALDPEMVVIREFKGSKSFYSLLQVNPNKLSTLVRG